MNISRSKRLAGGGEGEAVVKGWVKEPSRVDNDEWLRV